ncbi:MAG: hypothetical protein LBQ28_10190 [Prevotellaceae bacterium]|jgi:hypothetical protein|nr:hypothetical protein [Prevotellaceae bacterium]
MKKNFYILFLICLLFAACKSSKKIPNVDNIAVNVQVVRFDKDIFSIQDVSVLHKKYGSFFDNFCDLILGIGTHDSVEFQNNFNRFLGDSIVQLAQNKASEILNNYEQTLNKELTQAFKFYKYYFPEKNIPQIYIFTSGFNPSLILDKNIIGIGMDKFLGSDEDTYKYLGFSKYLVQNMRKERIVCEVIGALAMDEFPLENMNPALIEKMIYEGKILYFKQQLCPYMSENDLSGFAEDNMNFCKNNEKQMWLYLIENKLLYSNNYTVITKFTEDAPFTYDFSQESPGKAANWVGFRIIEQYVNKTNTSLANLMNETDYEKILRESKYNPKN